MIAENSGAIAEVIYGTVHAKMTHRYIHVYKSYTNDSRLNRYNFRTVSAIFILHHFSMVKMVYVIKY